METSIRDNTLNIIGNTSLCYDNIDFIKAVTIELAYEASYSRLSKKPIWKSLFKVLYPLKNKVFDKILTSKVIFTSYVNRKDYDELIAAAKKDISESVYIRILQAFKRQLSFPKQYYNSIFKAVWNMKLSLTAKFALSSILIDYMSSYLSLKAAVIQNNVDLSKVTYIPFNSSVGMESILTQYLNQNGAKTYHLCHGLHFAPNYRFFSVDAFNKELITANTVLSWGQSFVDNDNDLHKHEIVGNPKYPEKEINIKIDPDSAIVLLARGQYDDNNCKLIEVLSEYIKIKNTKFYVKPHPTCDIKRIRKLCDQLGLEVIPEGTLKTLFKQAKYGFAISYESTAYYEAMYHNMICFRYAYEENECYGELDNRFSNAEQLNCQVNKYLNFQGNRSKLNALIYQTLKYEIGMGINRYREVLQNDKNT